MKTKQLLIGCYFTLSLFLVFGEMSSPLGAMIYTPLTLLNLLFAAGQAKKVLNNS